jgi:hypothetical protein
VIIEGDEYDITPVVWEVFQGWYGDKAYRQASMVEDIEKTVRSQVRREQSLFVERFGR